MVPSSGSTSHRTPLAPPLAAPSSAMTASSGRSARSIATIADSAARCAWLPRSVGLDLREIPAAGAPNLPVSSTPPARAARTARSRRGSDGGTRTDHARSRGPRRRTSVARVSRHARSTARPRPATLPGVSHEMTFVAPRGYCAGVDRAIETVERVLDSQGAPVYVRGEIVHNQHVVKTLADRGAVFVDSELMVPEGETIILSAHGVSPDVHANCAARGLNVIDATCPLVSKVHAEVRRYAGKGATVLLVGHAYHDEVIGTRGEAPDQVILVEDIDQARTVEVPDPDNVALTTRTACRSTTPRTSSTSSRRAFRRCRCPPQATSATRHRIARMRSRTSSAGGRTSCSWSVRGTRRTRTAWWRSPSPPARTRT